MSGLTGNVRASSATYHLISEQIFLILGTRIHVNEGLELGLHCFMSAAIFLDHYIGLGLLIRVNSH